MMRAGMLVLGALAVWRVTQLFNAEDGPGRLLVKLRRLAGSGFWGELLDCFYCLSLWAAVPFAIYLGGGWGERLLLWPALSGAAILLERATAPAPAIYSEDPEGMEYELLRKSEKPDRETDSPAGSGDDAAAGADGVRIHRQDGADGNWSGIASDLPV